MLSESGDEAPLFSTMASPKNREGYKLMSRERLTLGSHKVTQNGLKPFQSEVANLYTHKGQEITQVLEWPGGKLSCLSHSPYSLLSEGYILFPEKSKTGIFM